jgi:hypothetical protein
MDLTFIQLSDFPIETLKRFLMICGNIKEMQGLMTCLGDDGLINDHLSENEYLWIKC